MRELEIRFHVPPDSLQSLRQELNRHGARSTRMTAHYFDTPGDALGSQQMSLRLRQEGRRWFQTLKAQRSSSGLDRFEHNAALRVPPGTMPVLDIARHDGTKAGVRLREVLGGATAETLVERYTTDVTRLACLLPLSGSAVEAALDTGILRSGERQQPICELELEHRSGDIAPLFALAQLWRRHGGLWLDSRSKAMRGATLARDLCYGTPVKARAPALQRDMDGARLLRTVMLSTLEQVLGNASELATGSSDEEHVHQLRVGVRRLRTVLRELAPLSEGFMSGWEPALSNAFAQLGAIRDDHAVAAAVGPLLERAGAPKLGWRSVNTADDPGAIVRADSFQDTLLDLLRWALSEPAWATPKHVPHEARRCLVERLSRLHRQVTRGGEAFEQLPEEERHQVRKRLKRLRYLAELVSTMWAHKATLRYLRPLSLAQDALGHHHDVTVAAAKFLADAQKDPISLFAAGYLKAHEAVTARQAHAALAQVTLARCFWKD
ncbi:MAG: CHAD domain-containing protein [Betaproteobacteria bacterium]